MSGLLTNENGQIMVGFDLQVSYGNRRIRDVTDINGRYEFAGLPGDRKVKLKIVGIADGPGGTGKNATANHLKLFATAILLTYSFPASKQHSPRKKNIKAGYIKNA